LAFGGSVPPQTGATEEYDGTSWTSSPVSFNSKRWLGGAGTQSAALAFGGSPAPTNPATEEWTGAGAGVTKTITVS
jgi:hypothetical protein